jgi:hypothetical protein
MRSGNFSNDPPLSETGEARDHNVVELGCQSPRTGMAGECDKRNRDRRHGEFSLVWQLTAAGITPQCALSRTQEVKTRPSNTPHTPEPERPMTALELACRN